MCIIILSRSENTHADAVADYCSRYVTVRRFDFDFETSRHQNQSIALGHCPDDCSPGAFFVHHPRISYCSEDFIDDLERKLFIASWDSLKEWLESQFPNALWINRPSASRNSRNVLHQLKMASLLGFDTPPTLFTNDTNHLREFAGNNAVVIKQGNLGVHLPGKRILTSIVDISSISPSELHGCPCLFQKYIDKRFELRIHVIGETILTCKIDSQTSPSACVDWRHYDFAHTTYEPYDLDRSTSNLCMGLVKSLGLQFGVIDAIITPHDSFVFLECNAQGHWIWVEQLTGLPITRSLSEHLLSGSTR